jgi:hypothetical protein
LSGVLTAPCSPLLCVSFQFLVYCSVFCFVYFFMVLGVSLPRGLCWFIPGVAGEIAHEAWCLLIGLSNVSKAGLEPASGSAGALLFSMCNVAWKSFVEAQGSAC